MGLKENERLVSLLLSHKWTSYIDSLYRRVHFRYIKVKHVRYFTFSLLSTVLFITFLLFVPKGNLSYHTIYSVTLNSWKSPNIIGLKNFYEFLSFLKRFVTDVLSLKLFTFVVGIIK